MSKNNSSNNLFQKYREALEAIADLQMEVHELKQELDDYLQAFDALQDELAEYR